MSRAEHWRETSAKIVMQVIEESACLDWCAMRKRVRKAYPFGPRAYFPYKIWGRVVAWALYGTPLRRRHPVRDNKNTGQLELPME